VTPKTCNWNCVYCQLGRTTPLSNERRPLVPAEVVLDDLRRALARGRDGIDWVTFVGSGEPTLHIDLGELIREARAMARVPVAVITNGALLHREDVRQELVLADAVLPSLDAGSEVVFRATNRPHPGLTCAHHVAGLVSFRSSFEGRLWVEVMLVAGLNDTPRSLEEIATALHRIEPDEVHLGVPSRPPAEAWVRAPESGTIERARSVLGGKARVVLPVAGGFHLDSRSSAADAILEVVTRHPMSEGELVGALSRGCPGVDVERLLVDLVDDERVQVVERRGQRFWSAANYRYGPGPRPSGDEAGEKGIAGSMAHRRPGSRARRTR
jgi:wyosine [tRNA(Phe)-imidazoG37] synthetase (radical SAM superfamily)